MTRLSNSELQIRLSSLIVDLERIRREAKKLDLGTLAFFIDYATEEGQRVLARINTPTDPLAGG
jgi:hypothetical protein